MENNWYGNNIIDLASNHIAMSKDDLCKLHLNPNDVDIMIYIASNQKSMSSDAIYKIIGDHKKSELIRYIYNIATGKIRIESLEAYKKHLKKLHGSKFRIGIQHLLLSKINKVPRKALIGGIKHPIYEIYNSNRYNMNERMYDVVSVGVNTVLKTKRKPVLKRDDPKKIDGVIEIKDKVGENITLSVNSKYVRLVNRYIIVASLKRPEFHFGLIHIICIEGTSVYVYATKMSRGETPNYKGGSQRVYRYGYRSKTIYQDLIDVASEMYRHIKGVKVIVINPNSDFNMIDNSEIKELDSQEKDIIDE